MACELFAPLTATTMSRQRFDDANLDLTNTAIKVNQTTAVMMPAMMLILNFATIGIIWFGSIRINNGEMQIGTLIAFCNMQCRFYSRY